MASIWLTRPVRASLLGAVPVTHMSLASRKSSVRGMAGHSKWANIRHKKGRNDKVKNATNTRMSRLVMTAVRAGGGDPNPDTNFELGASIRRATKAGVPKSVIENAIKLGSGKVEHGQLEQTTYEGTVGPALFLVECLTDNKNRTAPFVRHVFAKHDGSMQSNAASFAFETRGYLEVEVPPGADDSEIMEQILENDIEENGDSAILDIIEAEENVLKVYTHAKSLIPLAKGYKAAGLPVSQEQLIKFPLQTVPVENDEESENLMSLVEALEESEDVTSVWHNLA